MRRHLLGLLVSATIAIAALAGCGDDSPDDGSGAASADTTASADASDEPPAEEESPSPPPAEPGSSPEDTAKNLLLAYGDNDADTACGLQTERYTQDEIASAIDEGQLKQGADCRAMVALSSGYYQAFGLDAEKAKYELLNTKDDTARVKVVYSGDFGTSTFVMVERDGKWLLDEEIEQ